MGKRVASPNPDSDDHPYDEVAFAQKYDLTPRAAATILQINGPSRTACDAAARAFQLAVAALNKRA